MTVPAADNLRPLADARYGLARGFDDAQTTITAAADLLDAIDRKHHKIRYITMLGREIDSCAECAPTAWPCPTARLLHPDEVTP